MKTIAGRNTLATVDRIRTGAPPTARTAVIWAALDRELDRRGDAALDVIDVGGGTGGFAVPFALAGHRVTVIDASPDALASLARRSADAGVADRLRAVQGDGDQLGSLVAPATADIVLCHSVLEEVDHPEAVMHAIATALRPGGVASIVVANRPGAALNRALAGQLAQARALLNEPVGGSVSGGSVGSSRAGSPDRRRRFDADSAAALVQAAGFTVESIAGVRVIADLMPGALADADPAGMLSFELAASGLAPFRDIATALHILARVVV